jgi:8-oxo-dGTP diphosphatase
MPDPAPLMTVVSAAIVDADGRYLLQQRPLEKEHGGLWEFPGGKVEPGESPEAALAREIDEELGLRITAPEPFSFASEPRSGRHLLLLLFRVSRWSGEPRALEGATLRWCMPDELAGLDMPPADRPLARALAAWCAKAVPDG